MTARRAAALALVAACGCATAPAPPGDAGPSTPEEERSIRRSADEAQRHVEASGALLGDAELD
ncbi:MAG: hypothetical protein ACJ79L_10385, partial [Anaeromyxobacteraceae bacterium]